MTAELDALIKEGEKPADSGIKDVVDYVRQQQVDKHNEVSRKGMDAAVQAIQESIPEEGKKLFGPDVIEGVLYKRAEDDPALKKAFLERGQNPTAWNDAQRTLAKEFAKRFEETPDEQIEEDRAAVAAAAKTQPAAEEEELSLDQIEGLRKSDPQKWQQLQLKHGVTPYGQ